MFSQENTPVRIAQPNGPQDRIGSVSPTNRQLTLASPGGSRANIGMFELQFAPEAVEDLRAFRKFDQQQILEAIERQLSHQPGQASRQRKPLRPNRLADWELRVGDFRVFYRIDAASQAVRIVAVGQKQGNILFIHGEEFSL